MTNIFSRQMSETAFGFVMNNMELLTKIAPVHVEQTHRLSFLKGARRDANTFSIDRAKGASPNVVDFEAEKINVDLVEAMLSEGHDVLDIFDGETMNYNLVNSALSRCSIDVANKMLIRSNAIINTAGLYTLTVPPAAGNSRVPAVKWDVPGTADPRTDLALVKSDFAPWAGIPISNPSLVLLISRDLVNLIFACDDYKSYKKALMIPEDRTRIPDELRVADYLEVNRAVILEAYTGGNIPIFSEVCILCMVENPGTGIEIGNKEINSSTFLTGLLDQNKNMLAGDISITADSNFIGGDIVTGYYYYSQSGRTVYPTVLLIGKTYIANSTHVARVEQMLT